MAGHNFSAFLLAMAGSLKLPFGGARRRPPPRGGRTAPKSLTAFDCLQTLREAGWEDAGAGPNYLCVYLDRGPHKVALFVTSGDPVTPNALRELVADHKGAEYAAGRRCVAVYQGELTYGIEDEGAAQDVTLIHFGALASLEEALQATADAAAQRRAAEIRALTRAYDPPVPAPMRIAADPASTGPILETEAVACFLRDRGGDTLLISFANQWLRHDGRAFWADNVTRALGLSVVAFVAKSPNWYPPDDMAALLPEVRRIIGERFARRVLFGHSQGGFAAIKFSRVLGATTVLAFSPQYSIDGRVVADDRVNRYYTGQLHAGMAIEAADTAGSIFVFYDPREAADVRHAARIAEARTILPVQIPFVGHASDRGLTDPARFTELLAVSRLGDAAAMRGFMARERAVRVERPVLMALALAAKWPRTAAAILQTYGATWKTEQISAVCYRLAKAGQAALAFGPASRAAEDAPNNANAQGTAGLIALEQRQLDVARALIEKALALEPYNEKWRDAGRRVGALALAEPATADFLRGPVKSAARA
jgi:hypothetical protein